MPDFEFRKHVGGKPVILAPRRARRTNENGKKEPICPFCPGQEDGEEELYRVPAKGIHSASSGQAGQRAEDWAIRVIPNKFPFTPHHELVIHSPDHHKNFDELPFSQVELIFQTYRKRFVALQKHGQVYLFHNRGHAAGEGLPHPHTQITVVPNNVLLGVLPLDLSIYRHREPFDFSQGKLGAKRSHMRLLRRFTPRNDEGEVLETDHFVVFCPETSDWPMRCGLLRKSSGGCLVQSRTGKSLILHLW